MVVPLLMSSLQDNWRCLYLGDPSSVAMVGTALTAKGVNTMREADRGSLIFSSERSHLASGTFDPKSLIKALCDMIDEAVSDGYKGLCATGDMMWELGTEDNFQYLMEYEALLEQVFHTKPLQGICQYRKDVLPARAVKEALLTHPSCFLGDTYTQDNIYFMPPEVILRAGDSASQDAQGLWMCDQLMRTMRAEQRRDQAMISLMKSEAKQQQLTRKLAATNRELELRVKERTAELEETNKELQQFSYAVSHDLRAPLRAIDSFGQYLTEDFGDRLGAEGMEYVDGFRKKVGLMNEQINAMLVLSRIRKAELQHVDIDLSEVATSIAEELRRSEPDRQVEIVVQPEMATKGDPALLRSAFENLIGNAWKFTSKKATARIEVGLGEPQEGMTVFYVKDDGAGFDMRYANQLFGTFQRLHTPREFPGHGIGLATVQRIVQRHGGSVWADGVEGEGATFYVALPSAE